MYLALYRKYRPKTFAEVISQEHITTTLTNQVKSRQFAHAYLFTGSRGTGKTTCAKILAKAINCLNPIDGNPCNECEACKAIEAGTSDVLEIDAASNNGVDDVRALRDEVMYAPVSCEYRVYIIDEVHMMSGAAFNALLKTIEEPPGHVVFILATTENHKVPATILSRCQQYQFRRIAIEDSSKRLEEIAEKENVYLEQEAADLISQLSDGGMRDAISLLDQCVSVNPNITAKIVRDTAGIAGREYLFKLADCILNKDAPNALKTIDYLHSQSKDIGLLVDEMILHYRSLMLLKAMKGDRTLVRALPDEYTLFDNQTAAYSMGMIMRCLDILQECSEGLSRTKQRKTLAEMCFIKLCTPRLDTDLQAISLRLEKLELAIENGEMPTQSKPNVAQSPISVSDTITAPEISPISDKIKQITKSNITGQPIQNEKPIEKTEQKPTDNPTPKKPLSANNISNSDITDIPPEYPEIPFELPPPPFEEHQITTAPMEEIPPLEQPVSAPVQPVVNAQPAVDVQPEGDVQPTVDVQPEADVQPAVDVQVAVENKKAAADIAEDGKQVKNWQEVVEQVPDFLQSLLANTTAFYNGKVIEIENGNSLLKSFMDRGDSTPRLKSAIKNVLGKSYGFNISAKDVEINNEQETPVEKFLARARELGINIKEKE